MQREQSPVLDSLTDGFNDDSLLDEANSRSFDLKNELFELRSRCNALDYDNKKLVISYENTIKELKNKYAILERLLAEKAEKGERGERDEKHSENMSALAKKCEYLAEENETLRKELNNLYDRNRVTPNFNSPEFAQEVDALGELLQKEETIHRLEQELREAKEGEYQQLKNKLLTAEREAARLKEGSVRGETEKEEAVEAVSRQMEEHYSNVVKSKERIIEEMKNEQFSLVMQLEEARRNKADSPQTSKMYLAQLQERDSRVAECEEKIRQLQIENNSLKN
jgi:chromosome segregation ATPase